MRAKFTTRWSPILFVLPALAFYLVFVFGSLVNTFRLSLYEWDGANPVMNFVGFGNYATLFQDPLMWQSLYHNIIWILVTVFVPTSFALILAVLLSTDGLKCVPLFRVTFFMPSIVSMVVVSIVWGWIFNPQYGILNQLLDFLNLSALKRPWLGHPDTVLGALLTAGSWTHYGFCMVIFMASLQGIDKTYFEVAMIDGANAIQKLVYVTVPLLQNTITLLVLNSMIGSFKVFDIIWASTRGGPYHSSEVVSTYLYNKAFYMNETGSGAAIAMTLAVIIAICSAVYFKIAERE
ncbi:MAG: sugar ABC transporter permease [Clostridia bacterium]|nr:sugar ABC transporter permease [Clostridia bacterium]